MTRRYCTPRGRDSRCQSLWRSSARRVSAKTFLLRLTIVHELCRKCDAPSQMPSALLLHVGPDEALAARPRGLRCSSAQKPAPASSMWNQMDEDASDCGENKDDRKKL